MDAHVLDLLPPFLVVVSAAGWIAAALCFHITVVSVGGRERFPHIRRIPTELSCAFLVGHYENAITHRPFKGREERSLCPLM